MQATFSLNLLCETWLLVEATSLHDMYHLDASDFYLSHVFSAQEFVIGVGPCMQKIGYGLAENYDVQICCLSYKILILKYILK